MIQSLYLPKKRTFGLTPSVQPTHLALMTIFGILVMFRKAILVMPILLNQKFQDETEDMVKGKTKRVPLLIVNF